MKYQLNPPIHIGQEGRWLIPAAGTATADDRLFIVSDNAQVSEALITAINERLAERRKVTADDFGAMLDDAMPAAGERLKTCDLVMALMQPGGCLVAQMGKSRVLHIDAQGEVNYDSRNQILDFGAKARTEFITRFAAGDCLLLTLADRVDPIAVADVACDTALDEAGRAAAFTRVLASNREQAPASYVITLAAGSGGALRIGDVNWRWVALYLLLAAAIAAVAWASLTGRLTMPDFSSHETAAADTVPAAAAPAPVDTTSPPADAVEVPSEPAPQAKTDEARPAEKKPERRDDPPKASYDEPTPPPPPPAEPTIEPAAPKPTPEPVATPPEPATTDPA